MLQMIERPTGKALIVYSCPHCPQKGWQGQR